MLGSDYNSGRELNILNKGGIVDMETGMDLNGVWHAVCVRAQSCLTLCDSTVCSLPCSSVHGIFQARTQAWFAVSYSGGSSQPRDCIQVSSVSCIGRQILHHCATWEALGM